MYFTAHGRALPCCIAPFSVRGYSNYTLGNATQESLREIWNSPAYRDFRTACCRRCPRPHARIVGCDGACSLVIPTLNEAETIGAVIREIPAALRGTSSSPIAAARMAPRRLRLRGARVIDTGRGYGRACALGAAAADPACG